MAKVPYEFLVRWNHLTGEYQGSHVKLYDNVTMREGDAETVGATSMPLDGVLTAIEKGAIIAADNAIADLVKEQQAHQATQMELQKCQADNQQLATLVADLQKQLVSA